MTPSLPALDATLESIRVTTEKPNEVILQNLSLQIRPGEFVGVTGESGSGKTTTGLLLLGYLRRGLYLRAGGARIGKADMFGQGEPQLARQRGAHVAYVPQDPGGSLNPGLRIGQSLLEVFKAHGVSDPARREARIAALFGALELPTERGFRSRYPHQLSGGQQQRVAIALSFALQPRVVVLDEPTTGLDSLSKQHVVTLVQRLSREERSTILFISHDVEMLLASADRLLVMYAGRIVEDAPAATLREGGARHPYTRALLAALPQSPQVLPTPLAGSIPPPTERDGGCDFASRCTFACEECRAREPQMVPAAAGHLVRCLRPEAMEATPAPRVAPTTDSAAEPAEEFLRLHCVSARHNTHTVTHDVEFTVDTGDCVAVVGESGSGKTTLARCIAGLHSDYGGNILIRGRPLAASVSRRRPEDRRAIQYVFQNPYASLNPRRTAGASIALAAELLDGKSHQDAMREAQTLLGQVGLGPRHFDAYPKQLSGGECQRVALARALIARPQLLVCDEITASLDISIQAGVLALLRDLQQRYGLALLFITHDMPLAASFCNRVVVLRAGRIVESGPSRTVFQAPTHPYTHQLLKPRAILREGPGDPGPGPLEFLTTGELPMSG